MIDDDNTTKGERTPFLIEDHRIAVLITATIIIACISASIGMVLYNASGTAQLDLSRPSYEGVGEIVERERETYTDYPASGTVDESELRKFDELYRDQAKKLTSIEAFGADPLSSSMLGIEGE